MIKHRRLSALMVFLVLGIAVIATSGIAYGAWVWCDDPVLSIGSTTVYVNYEADINGPTQGAHLADYFKVSMKVSVPKGVDFAVLNPHGWKITSHTDGDLHVSSEGIKTDLTVLVLPKPAAKTIGVTDDTAIKVRVSLDPDGNQVLAWGEGHVRDTIGFEVTVPVRK